MEPGLGMNDSCFLCPFSLGILFPEPGCLSLLDGDPLCAAVRLFHVNAQGGYEVDPAFYPLGGDDRIPQGKTSGACG